MSRYSVQPLSLENLSTIPLSERGGKVRPEHFAAPYRKASGVAALIESLPRQLAGDQFRSVVEAIVNARRNKRAIVWGLGGHVIKCGLAPVLADLAQRGFATAFASNGSAAIHDWEMALAGFTSEDVESVLPDGRFGSADETGRTMNQAAIEGHRDGLGLGEAYGRTLDAIADPPFRHLSLLLAAYTSRIPFTVHVAFGTDTPHMHPAADPASLGAVTHHDFRLFCQLVAGLNDGGVYINLGSAVIMPEVFLKAVSAVRNLQIPLTNFVTVNMDFLQHYRPRVNVVERPHAIAALGQKQGRGYALTGHHELMVPLLAAVLIETEE